MNVIRADRLFGSDGVPIEEIAAQVNEKPGLFAVSPDLIYSLAKRADFHAEPQREVDYNLIKTDGSPPAPVEMPLEQAEVHQAEYERSLGDLAVAVGAGLGDPEKLVA